MGSTTGMTNLKVLNLFKNYRREPTHTHKHTLTLIHKHKRTNTHTLTHTLTHTHYDIISPGSYISVVRR
jgi:hypothetical protein